MSDHGVTESVVEQAALAWFESLGYAVKAGPDIAPDGSTPERGSYTEVILPDRLRQALAQLNPSLPGEALDDAFRRLTRPEGPTLEARNRAFHQNVVDGVTVEYRKPGGAIAGAQVRVLDFEEPDRNDWLVVNQFTVAEQKHTRRPDVVVFVNGLPLGLIELKNAAAENATIWTAFQQIQTYKGELSDLFAFNALLVVSDGVEARIGSLTAGREWFKPWRTVSGEGLADPHLSELQVMIEGVFHKDRLLDLVRHFIVFEDEGGGRLIKKIAGYHQFHAVGVAVRETLRAADLSAGEPSVSSTLRVVRPKPGERYRTCVPLVPLKAAAGSFGDPQHVRDEEFEWVAIEARRRLRPGMFVARVEGRSMEPAIPDGAWCLFSAPVEGTRQEKTVLVELRDAVDPETGERYTVKRYESEKTPAGDSWRHARITLRPLNPAYEPIVLSPSDEERLQVVAEVVEVLGQGDRQDHERGDRRVGVVWHTQGSGKSLTMSFYAGKVIRQPAMENPTRVQVMPVDHAAVP